MCEQDEGSKKKLRRGGIEGQRLVRVGQRVISASDRGVG